MSLKCRFFATRRRCSGASRALALVLLAGVAVGIAACGSGASEIKPPPPVVISSIVIDGGSREVERGTILTLTATVKDTAGKVISVPVVWHSSVDTIGHFGIGGVLTTNDTGATFITASALGVTSAPIEILVEQNGAFDIEPFKFAPPLAVSPGTNLGDSVRVIVTNSAKGPAVGALVLFSVGSGGGTVSPKYATVTQTGVVAASWILGPAVGKNTLTASVVFPDDSVRLDAFVKNNPTIFTVTSFNPLSVVKGDAQTASVLSALPVAPLVKLVDSLGKPRPGIPITFAPTGNGRVANTVVSTAVDGTASPGIWTLGDLQGDEQLVVTVESATLTLHATATGSTVQFAAVQVATAQAATCFRTADQFVSCLGQWPQIGTGPTQANQSTPTLTAGGIHFTSIVGASARFCGTAPDLSIFCWGNNPLVDTVPASATHQVLAATGTPTQLPSNIAWLQVSVGGQHTCALANDKTAYCWGLDTDGQLGDNGTDSRAVPAPVTGGFKFSTLAGGGSHECGITVDGLTFCWGANSSGQIGDGTNVSRRTPTAVSGGVKFSTIAAGQATTCGLDVAGVAYCWGANTIANTPTSYPNAPAFSSLSVGALHQCALTNDGTAYCWGDNSNGELGDSTTTSRQNPTAVVTTIRFRSISAGFQHTCGLSIDGFAVCWGRNQFGELGVSTPLIQTTPRFIVLEVKP